jgi:hypothetical protein
MELWNVILTSAVCSALVAGFIGFINAWLDRRSSAKELKFKLAVELAREHVQRRIDLAFKNNQASEFYDSVFVAESYLECMDVMFKTGQIPDRFWDKIGGRPKRK